MWDRPASGDDPSLESGHTFGVYRDVEELDRFALGKSNDAIRQNILAWIDKAHFREVWIVEDFKKRLDGGFFARVAKRERDQ